MAIRRSCWLVAFLAAVVAVSPAVSAEPAKTEPPPFKKDDLVRVNLEKSSVMAGTSVVAVVSRGETFRLVEVRGEWLAIVANANSGWIRAADVLRVDEPAPPAPTPAPAPLPRPAPRPNPSLGDRYALLVGVREYDATELKSLQFSENDIEVMAAQLPQLGYERANIVVMTQTRGAQKSRHLPIAANIRREMELLLAEAGPQDSLLIAFSGHGVQFKDEERQQQQVKADEQSYFCPADARLNDRQTLIPLNEVYQGLERCKAGTKILLVDACRNDPQSALSRSRAVVHLETVSQPQKQAPPGGVTALFSCSAGQQSFEHPDLKHGVFFHYIVEGLRGKADFDQDSDISLQELELYAAKQVQKFVRTELGQTQTPERRGEARGLLSIGRLNQ